MKIRTVIAPTERGLMIKNKAIVDILPPGVYWQVQWADVCDIEVVSIVTPRCEHTGIDALTKTNPALAKQHLTVVDVGNTEVGLVFEDNRLTDLLAPGARELYWNGLVEVRVEYIDLTTEYQVSRAVAQMIGRTGSLAKRAASLGALLGIDVQDKQVGFL